MDICSMSTQNNCAYQVLGHERDNHILRQSGQKRWYETWSPAVLISYAVFAVFWLFSMVLMYQYAVSRVERATRLCGQMIYSPAQEFVEYEVRIFSQGSSEEHSDYYGPPDDRTDRLWRELWSVGGGQGIPREQASRLANRTSRIPPNWPDLYYVDIDVFHQLHCLDHIRHALANDTHYLHSAELLGEGHLYHCFETLRESLMCHGDISTIVQQWSPSEQREVMRGDVPHTCRNFWKLHAWAREHAIGNSWDSGHDHVDYDLEISGLEIQQI